MHSFRELQLVYEGGYTNAQTMDFPSQSYGAQDGKHTYHRGQLPGGTPGSGSPSSLGIPVENEEEDPSAIKPSGSIDKKNLLDFIYNLVESKDGSVDSSIYDIIAYIRKS
jgi:hypothetical protein